MGEDIHVQESPSSSRVSSSLSSLKNQYTLAALAVVSLLVAGKQAYGLSIIG